MGRGPAAGDGRTTTLMGSVDEPTRRRDGILHRQPTEEVIHCSIMGPGPRHPIGSYRFSQPPLSLLLERPLPLTFR
jgi:hypothetical protein